MSSKGVYEVIVQTHCCSSENPSFDAEAELSMKYPTAAQINSLLAKLLEPVNDRLMMNSSVLSLPPRFYC